MVMAMVMEWNGMEWSYRLYKNRIYEKTYVIPVSGAPHVASHASELGLQKPHPHSEKGVSVEKQD